jgi:hypothetical protein
MERSTSFQLLKIPLIKKGKVIITWGEEKSENGLSEEAKEIIRKIFTFCYMGKAKFEGGTVAKAITFMWNKKGELITGKVKTKTSPTYFISLPEHEKHVRTVILNLSEGIDRSEEMIVRQYTGFEKVLKDESYDEKLKGWLEINNGFFFFINYKMFKETAMKTFDITEEKIVEA